MKIFLITLLMAFQVNAYELTLKFEDKEEARQWVVWYLDGGGEQFAGFYAYHVEINSIINVDGVNTNLAPYLFLVQDKEFDSE